MTLLLNEILEKLKREDEIQLMELLEINSEMILERFPDLVEDRQEYLEEYLND